MNLSKAIGHHLADIPAGARLVSVDAHQDDDFQADAAGCICEFDSGDMFQVSVPLEGKPFSAALRSEIESMAGFVVAVSHGLRMPEVS